MPQYMKICETKTSMLPNDKDKEFSLIKIEDWWDLRCYFK